MCAVCRKNPCDSRCPNAEEPEIYIPAIGARSQFMKVTSMDTQKARFVKRLHRRYERNRILRVTWRIIQNSRRRRKIEWKIRQECSQQHHKRHQLFSSKTGKRVAFPGQIKEKFGEVLGQKAPQFMASIRHTVSGSAQLKNTLQIQLSAAFALQHMTFR